MRRLFTVLLVLLLPAVGCAAPAKAPQSGPSLLDRAAVIRAARKVTRARFPNADDVLVDNHVRTVYRADGTSETLDDTYEKVLTEKGKREARTLSFHFTLPYGTVTVPLMMPGRLITEPVGDGSTRQPSGTCQRMATVPWVL